MEPVDAVLVVDGVSKSFGSTQALSDVSIALARGRVHGVVGRNGAGKSTLVKIIMGELEPDRGAVTLADSDLGASRADVAAVHQELKLVPHLSVAENVMLGVYSRMWISWRELRSAARQVLDDWGLDVPVDAKVGDLRLDQQQIIVIARALNAGARIVLLDEPTSRLNWGEAAELLAQVRRLATRGVSFLFISHSLHEVLALCDDVTVLRDGRVVAGGPAAEFTEDAIIERMSSVRQDAMPAQEIGVADAVPAAAGTQPDVHLQDHGTLPGRRSHALEASDVRVSPYKTAVTFNVDKGEWVGITGLVGSGAVSLACTIAGYGEYSAGSIKIAGVKLKPGRADHASALGVGFLPPDRHRNGLVPTLSVGANIGLTSLRRLSNIAGFVRHANELSMAEERVARFGIVTAGISAPVTSLSGGNQQKVLIARAFSNEPSIIVLANPTVGVDVASKRLIYSWMKEAKAAGIAGIVASEDELSDLELCDRVLVLQEGAVVHELDEHRSAQDVLSAIERGSSTMPESTKPELGDGL